MSILPVTQKNIVIMQMIGAIIRPFAVPMRLLPHVSVPTAENTHSRARCVTNRSWQIQTHTNTHTRTHILQMFTATKDILAISPRKGTTSSGKWRAPCGHRTRAWLQIQSYSTLLLFRWQASGQSGRWTDAARYTHTWNLQVRLKTIKA